MVVRGDAAVVLAVVGATARRVEAGAVETTGRGPGERPMDDDMSPPVFGLILGFHIESCHANQSMERVQMGDCLCPR